MRRYPYGFDYTGGTSLKLVASAISEGFFATFGVRALSMTLDPEAYKRATSRGRDRLRAVAAAVWVSPYLVGRVQLAGRLYPLSAYSSGVRFLARNKMWAPKSSDQTGRQRTGGS